MKMNDQSALHLHEERGAESAAHVVVILIPFTIITILHTLGDAHTHMQTRKRIPRYGTPYVLLSFHL